MRTCITLLLSIFIFHNVSAQSFKITASKAIGCVGSTVTLSATTGFSSYKWSTGSTTREIKVQKTSWYSVKALDRSGKAYGDSIYIQFVKGVELKLSGSPKNATICPGDSLVIEANSGFKWYYWTDQSTKGNRAVYFPKKSGKIVVEAADSNGCEDRAEFSFTVKDSCDSCDIVEVVGGANRCGGDSAKILVADGFDTYSWTDGTKGRFRWVSKSGWFKVKACKKNACCEDSVYVEFHKKRAFNIDSDPKNARICKGDEIVFEATKGMKEYGWNVSKSDDYRIKIKPEKSGAVVVETLDSNGCEYRFVKYYTVKDSCSDSCNILGAWPSTTACVGDTITMEVRSGFSSYKWSDGGKGRKRYATKSGWYVIEACDSTGCCKDSLYLSFSKRKTMKLFSNPSPAVVCKGDKIIVEATTGFKRYWWNVGKGDGDRTYFYAERSGKVVVEATDSNGCSTGAVLEYTVKDTCQDSCDILGVSPKRGVVCKGDTITLEVKSGFKTYNWSDGEKGRIRYITKSGWYKVKACDGSACCEDSVYLKVHEKKKFELGTSAKQNKICLGDTLVVEVTAGMKSYWFSTGHRYRFFKMVPKKSFKLVVEAVDENGCSYRKQLFITVDSCTSSATPLERNPNIQWSAVGTELVVTADEAVQVRVFDFLGRVLFIGKDHLQEQRISMNEWPDGVILVFHTKNGGLVSKKWIRYR